MPVESQLLETADRIVGALGIPDRPLQAEPLLRAAQRRTRLEDFGDTSFHEPLGILLGDYTSSANLSLFGRISARWDTLRYLTNLLLMREAERRSPAIRAEPIVRPIFITGMPRSGTSFMHQLLSLDPGLHVPRCWETLYPQPQHPRGRWPLLPGRVPLRSRMRAAERRLNAFARLVPELLGLHPISADSPQECTEIMGHVFRSLRFDMTHDVPNYRRWLHGSRHLPAYEFHRRFLQHLQYSRGRGRWVLKSPDHVFALEAIRAVFPDAGLVCMHRDPLRVLPSVARLTEVLRRPFSRRVDRAAIGRQVRDSWVRGATILREQGSRPSPGGTPVLHVRFHRFVLDPLATVEELYRHFDMPLGEDQRARLQSAIAAERRVGRGTPAYRLRDYGLERHHEAALFQDYMQHFGIEPEALA
ncbi:MAG TPA: sulfotransferase [Steroidobacteraceae bacterium]|nr:sulfotransferase [Steroidobacteraceae bacterium]